jgi:succinate dehydrogenase / fumarate reductase cytochrome b subunit
MPRKDLVSYSTKVGYCKHPGMLMWLFHRVSGVMIGLFLVAHIVGIATPLSVGGLLTALGISKFVMAFMALLFVLHTANGVRIILMEFACSGDHKKFMPHIMITLGVVGVVGGILAIKLVLLGLGVGL